MNVTRSRLAGLVLLLSWLLVPTAALAQYRVLPEKPEAESGGTGKGGLYLKAGLAYWQGEVLNKSSLTEWNVDLFGANYDLTSAGVEIEAYLGKRLIVPGFSIGYRKDAIRSREAGHMVSATAFAALDLRLLMIKAGGGAEWGVPAMTFDQTEFSYGPNGTVRYRHTYPIRNARVPVGTRTSGALYPLAVLAVSTRPGPFLLEVGMRVNMTAFCFDDYEVRPGDQVTRSFSSRRVKMPLLFANIGVKLF